MSEKDLWLISLGIGTFSSAFYLLMSFFEDAFVKIAFYLLLIFLVILIGGIFLMHLHHNKISKLLSVIGVIGSILSVFGMEKLLSFFGSVLINS